jgi:hypothetical protein
LPFYLGFAKKGINSCLLILNISAAIMILILLRSFEFNGPALESDCTVQNWITLWENWGYCRSATEDSIQILYPAMMSGKLLLTFWKIIIALSLGSISIRQVIIIGYVRFEVLMAVKFQTTQHHTQYPWYQGYTLPRQPNLPNSVTINKKFLSLFKEFLGNLVFRSGTPIYWCVIVTVVPHHMLWFPVPALFSIRKLRGLETELYSIVSGVQLNSFSETKAPLLELQSVT